MKAVIAASLFACASFLQLSYAETDLERADKVISSAVRPKMLKEFLVDLKLVDPWTEKGDAKILLNIESNLGGIGRDYRAVGFPKLRDFFFAGKLPKPLGEDLLNYAVTKIIISSRTHFYVYYWIDGKYTRTNESELPKRRK